MAARVKAKFIEPMLLLRTDRLPEGPQWAYEIKFDGYRAIAFKTGGKVYLRSRNDHDFNNKYPLIVRGLASLPNDSVIDGEVVAFDAEGRPSFNILQNLGTRPETPLAFFVFDVMVWRGRDVTREPLSTRREIVKNDVMPTLSAPVRYMPPFDETLSVLIHSVKMQAFEGLTAKRTDSPYEPGQRSGAWQKMRVNRGQEFVIGGYTVGSPFDALIFGYYEGEKLLYAARTRAGFTSATRAQLAKRFKALEIDSCPFTNLPEKRAGRWGQGITKEKMKDCRWLKPDLVGQFEFVEWTPDAHLRHSKFVALREDKKARDVVREEPREEEA
jgi:DNA ligase D-like protein (predicted ligase)